MTTSRLVLGLTLVVGALMTSQPAVAAIIENFDFLGNTPWNLFYGGSGGVPYVVMDGSTGNFLRIANLNGSNNNSIAFDEQPSQTGPAPGGLKLAFDFRGSDDAANAAAGGCCGSAANGMGVGLFSTAIYGSAGGVNPTTMGQGSDIWERPAFNGAFAVGLDVFQNIDEVSLNWNGAQIANADVSGVMDLNDNTWHRAVIEILPNGSDATANMTILEDVHGNTDVHNIFSGVTAAGLDMNALGGYRLIAGGRTGDAFLDGDLDNFGVFAVPEPTSLTLLGISSLWLLAIRRRRNRSLAKPLTS